MKCNASAIFASLYFALIILCVSVSMVRAEESSAFRAQLSAAAVGFWSQDDFKIRQSGFVTNGVTTDEGDAAIDINFDARGFALSGKTITELTLFRIPTGSEIRIQASAAGRKWNADELDLSATSSMVTRRNGVVTSSTRDTASLKVDGGEASSITGLVGAYIHDPNVGFLGGFVAAGRNEDLNARTFGASAGLFTSLFSMPLNVRLNGGLGDGEQDLETWYMAASAEGFLTPEWALLFDVGYGDAETRRVEDISDPSFTRRSIETFRADVFRIGLESRWQIEQSPLSLSIFGNYMRTDGTFDSSLRASSPPLALSIDSSLSVDNDYFEGGVRFTMALGAPDKSSLLQQSRQHAQDLGIDNVMGLNGIYSEDSPSGPVNGFFTQAILP